MNCLAILAAACLLAWFRSSPQTFPSRYARIKHLYQSLSCRGTSWWSGLNCRREKTAKFRLWLSSSLAEGMNFESWLLPNENGCLAEMQSLQKTKRHEGLSPVVFDGLRDRFAVGKGTNGQELLHDWPPAIFLTMLRIHRLGLSVVHRCRDGSPGKWGVVSASDGRRSRQHHKKWLQCGQCVGGQVRQCAECVCGVRQCALPGGHIVSHGPCGSGFRRSEELASAHERVERGQLAGFQRGSCIAHRIRRRGIGSGGPAQHDGCE